MKMRVHVKLIILFMAGWLLMAGTGIAVNFSLQKRSDEQKLERKNNQVQEVADRIHHCLHDIEIQLLEWSISKETNIFSMYTWENNRAAIYEESDILFQQLQRLKSTHDCLNRTWLIFAKQHRQITDRIRYDEIEQDMYQQLLSKESPFLDDSGNMYYVSVLSVSLVQDEKSLAAAEVSIAKLMEEFSLPADDMQMRLVYPENNAAGEPESLMGKTVSSGTWKKVSNGWTILYPIPIDRMEKKIIYLESFLPAASLKDGRQYYLIWSIMLMMLGALSIFYFYVILRRIVMRPLNMLLEAFDSAANGNMDLRIDGGQKDEFGIIYQHYNEIAGKLKTLIEKEYKSRIYAKNAEIKYLQAQMKPHFLYNSFYQIYRMCRAEDAEESAEFALLLSKYFEYITRTGDAECLVPLHEEVSQAERYVQIQRFRFGDQLQVIFDIPESIQDCSVPKFILQPVLENAIKYSYENQVVKHCAMIKVTGALKDHLEITIEDNGNLIQSADIEAIRQKLNESMKSYINSGLVNVHMRLKMISEQGGVTISQSELGGLLVKLEIYPNLSEKQEPAELS